MALRAITRFAPAILSILALANIVHYQVGPDAAPWFVISTPAMHGPSPTESDCSKCISSINTFYCYNDGGCYQHGDAAGDAACPTKQHCAASNDQRGCDCTSCSANGPGRYCG